MLERQLAGFWSSFGGLAIENTQSEFPTDNGGADIDIFYVNDVLKFRDRDGVTHPVILGADGAGVRTVLPAASPYTVVEMDRLVLPNTTTGAITVRLPAAGGPTVGRLLIIADPARTFGTNAVTIDGNGKNIGGAATLVLNVTGSAVVLFWTGVEWSIVAGADVAAAVAPHAPSHLATGSDPLLAAPGTIGGTTPGVVNSPSLYLTASAPAAVATKTQVLQNPTTTGILIVGSGGQIQSLEADPVSGTMSVRTRKFAVQIAASGTYDINIGAKGGRIQVTAVGATGSSYATASFADNGATTFNGATYTGYSTTLGTPASVNIAASGGNVRIENLLATATNFLVVVEQLSSV